MYLTGLDIGSSNIKAAVAELKKDGELILHKIFKSPSRGVRKGLVDELGEITGAINQIINEIKKDFPNAHKKIYLNTGNAQIKTQTSRGIIAVSRADNEICHEDINRALDASRSLKMPPNRMILHSITREFVVDGVADIRDPLGMVGHRLEANVLLVDTFLPAINNIRRCVEANGGGIKGLIFGPLASARSVLTKNQKDLGVALVDIGFGTTSVCVYEENKLLYASVLPFGAGNITNDLAIGLKTSIEAAEAIKYSFGAALAKNMPVRETIDLSKVDSRARGITSKRFVAEIIEVRLTEIFEHINNELRRVDKEGRLPAGVVLVGGGAKLPGLIDLTIQEMKLPTKIGIPDIKPIKVDNGELALHIEDPEFACCLGLLLCGHEETKQPRRKIKIPIYGWVQQAINYFMP